MKLSLLRDIQNAAVDTNTDVATLLRMCKILAVRLKSEEFKRWVDHELNGYRSDEDLPEYRILHTQSEGHFFGPSGQTLKNAPIPPSCLPKELRDGVTKAYFYQPISAIASIIEKKEDAIQPWPADVAALYGRKIYQDMNCISAWKVIPHGAVVALVDTIKSLVLNFVLEIEKEAPDAGEAAPHQVPLPERKLSHAFNTYITGNVQNVATGSSHFTQAGEFRVVKGDFSTLAEYLRSNGVANKDVEDLKVAIDADKKMNQKAKLGKRVQAWLAKMFGKAASGTWRVSTSAAGTVLGEALSSYFGLES